MKNLILAVYSLVNKAYLMSDNSVELEIQITKFLGSAKTHWQGHAVKITLPADVVEKLRLKRSTGTIIKDRGDTVQLLFFDTSKGILLKAIDNKTEKQLKDMFRFNDISELSEEDLKLLFSDVSTINQKI